MQFYIMLTSSIIFFTMPKFDKTLTDRLKKIIDAPNDDIKNTTEGQSNSFNVKIL